MSKLKKWNISGDDSDPSAVQKISGELRVSMVTAQLLYNRGYRTPKEAERFIRLEAELFHDPFLLSDMDKACERIVSALKNKEKIVIYGDYDVDGVTSVSILYLFLKDNGADVDYYIPSRAGEGYGVNRDAVAKLCDDGMKLLITVDTGITAVAETEFCRELGADVIITDHHECHETLPCAAAVVNPRKPGCPYPFKELAGVGVAFKLITALEYTLRKVSGRKTAGFLEYICREYIDLAALGTVADVMPLTDENRLIVSMGINNMESSARPGVAALIEASEGASKQQRGKPKKRKITSSLIGYTLAPRINAAGRISCALKAVELFLTDNPEKAAEIAEELCNINRMRQSEENKIIEQTNERIELEHDFEKDLVIVLDDESWHHGIIGIVSSRITDKYNRPSILISFEGDIGKGSGRSIRGLNLVEALMSCGDLLIKFGGHELAAGLSIERDKLPEFKRRINEYAREHLNENNLFTTVDIECEVEPEDITLRQAEELGLLEPYGVSNPVPLFLLRDLIISQTVPIGSNHHTKLIFEKDGKSFPAVYFGISPDELGYSPGETVDVIFNLSINEFMGIRSAQMLIRDIHYSPSEQNKRLLWIREYGNAASEEPVLEVPSDYIPQREDFVSTYLRLKRILAEGSGTICINSLLYSLNATPSPSGNINYVRLRLVLDILAQSGVIYTELRDDGQPGLETFNITINNLETKVNLEKSCLYKRLKNPAQTRTPV